MCRATSRHIVCGRLCFRSQSLIAVPTRPFCQHLGPLICKLSPLRLPLHGDKCVYILAKHWHGMSFDYNMKHKRGKKRKSELLNHLNAKGSQSKWLKALHQYSSLTVTQTAKENLRVDNMLFSFHYLTFVYDPIIFLWTHTIIQCFSLMHWGSL